MNEHTIPLWPARAPHSQDDFMPTLTRFQLPMDKPCGAVLILPGGGYMQCSEGEGEPVAHEIIRAGCQAFVLNYRVAPNRHPAPLMDVTRAIRMIRKNAAEWNVIPDRIAVLGFSAGGHLAASLSVLYKDFDFKEEDDLSHFHHRPDASILCYPVISSGEHAHKGSFENLLGSSASAEKLAAFSIEKHIHDDVPPAFLWHTCGDDVVPVENSLLYAQELSRRKIPFELHIYPGSEHGLSLAEDDPHIASWMPLAIEWLLHMQWAGDL